MAVAKFHIIHSSYQSLKQGSFSEVRLFIKINETNTISEITENWTLNPILGVKVKLPWNTRQL